MGLPVRVFLNFLISRHSSVIRYAWPPHQIMAWVGLERYGYLEEAQRLAYRFLYMCVGVLDFQIDERAISCASPAG